MMTMNRQDVSSLHALAGIVVAAAPARLRQALDAFRAGYSSASPTVTAAIDALQRVAAQANGNLQLVITGLSATQPVLAAAIERAQEARHEHRARRVSHGCTCSYGDSEEMTRHAPLCATQSVAFCDEVNCRNHKGMVNKEFCSFCVVEQTTQSLYKMRPDLRLAVLDKLHRLLEQDNSARLKTLTTQMKSIPELHWQYSLIDGLIYFKLPDGTDGGFMSSSQFESLRDFVTPDES